MCNMLTKQRKLERVHVSQHNLDMLKRNRLEFMRHFVTVDDTWIHHYTPETSQQSKQWLEAGGTASKCPKTQYSAGKVMATVFWDVRGIIHIVYSEKEKTINAQHYSDLLDRFDADLKAKRQYFAKKNYFSPKQCTSSQSDQNHEQNN